MQLWALVILNRNGIANHTVGILDDGVSEQNERQPIQVWLVLIFWHDSAYLHWF